MDQKSVSAIAYVVIATIYNHRSDPNHQIELGVVEPQGTDMCQII